jgi:hypothetical protein
VGFDPEPLITPGFAELQQLSHPLGTSSGQEKKAHHTSQETGKQQAGNAGGALIRQPISDRAVENQENKDEQRDGQDVDPDPGDPDQPDTGDQNRQADTSRGPGSIAGAILWLHTARFSREPSTLTWPALSAAKLHPKGPVL